jgi:hypothetical protein
MNGQVVLEIRVPGVLWRPEQRHPCPAIGLVRVRQYRPLIDKINVHSDFFNFIPLTRSTIMPCGW